MSSLCFSVMNLLASFSRFVSLCSFTVCFSIIFLPRPRDHEESFFLMSRNVNRMLGLQVAELVGESMLVGVIRGCIKCVRTGQGAANVRMGCILGLRVSSNHRLVA